MFNKLKKYDQWVVSNPSTSKIPLQITGEAASVTDSSHWSSYKAATKAVKDNVGTHIGFVFTPNDPFCVFDLDNKQSIKDIQTRNDLIVSRATEHGHYCEVSFSGKGYHVIYEGTQLTSRRRGTTEFYTQGRYIILTQNSNGKKVTVDKQKLFDELYLKEFPPEEDIHRVELTEVPETATDDEVMERFRSASNGHYNTQLYDEVTEGDQSALDQSLIERLCFYTDANEQVRRLFKASKRGRRSKVAARGNEYIDRSIQHSRAVNEPDDAEVDVQALGTFLQREEPAADFTEAREKHLQFPPGLAGLMSQYFYINSVQPIRSFAIANTLTTLAGVVGRRYAFRGSTINIFQLIIGRSGSGKDASRRPLYELKKQLDKKGLLFGQFMGPESASGQALFATLAEQPCYSVYTGELADDLLMISGQKASENGRVMCNAYLRLYDEQDFGGKVHRDAKNNVQAVERPAVSIMGSGTPDFFEAISDHAIKRGLIPRFIVLEHVGRTPAYNDYEFAPPHPDIINGIKRLVESALVQQVLDVGYAEHAVEELALKYREDITNLQDNAVTLVEQGLYNRVHLNIMRVASILAACENPKKPVITLEILEWSHSYLMHSLNNLVGKFRVGELGGNSAIQREQKLLDLFPAWYNMQPSKRGTYGRQLIDKPLFVPRRFLNNRCKNIGAFTNDPRGYDRAFKDTLISLEMNEDVAQISNAQKKQHGITMKQVYVRRVNQ